MARKRSAVANRVITNEMAMWAVCGSAVACGTRWSVSWSDRQLPTSLYEMLGLLADGHVDHQACSGVHGIKVSDEMNEWHITSGTGLIIVTKEGRQHGEAFVCAKKNYTEYNAICEQITKNMVKQIRKRRTSWRRQTTTTTTTTMTTSQ